MQLGTYKHSKTGKYYLVTGVGIHSETGEELVVYECLYDNPKSNLWIRPKRMFLEHVTLDGESVPRFVHIPSD